MSYKKAKDKKSNRSWYTYLPFVFLIALVGNGLMIFSQVSKTVHENAGVVEAEPVSAMIGGREYNNADLTDDDFRKMARQLDDEVLEAYQNSKVAQRKEARRERAVDYNSDPEYFKEERIRSMRDELERNFTEEDQSEKGSVAYELKKTIERMEQNEVVTDDFRNNH